MSTSGTLIAPQVHNVHNSLGSAYCFPDSLLLWFEHGMLPHSGSCFKCWVEPVWDAAVLGGRGGECLKVVTGLQAVLPYFFQFP